MHIHSARNDKSMRVVIRPKTGRLVGSMLRGLPLLLVVLLSACQSSFHDRLASAPVQPPSQPNHSLYARAEAESQSSGGNSTPVGAIDRDSQASSVRLVSYDDGPSVEPETTRVNSVVPNAQKIRINDLSAAPVSSSSNATNSAAPRMGLPHTSIEGAPLNISTSNYVPRNDGMGWVNTLAMQEQVPPYVWQHPSGPAQTYPRDEYLFDGGDRESTVVIGDDWSVRGLNMEDTIAHYDTLAGERRVTPSNRVEIYAPRFASVRKVYGIIQDQNYGHMSQIDSEQLISDQIDSRGATTTHQHLQPDGQIGRRMANVFRDDIRGLTVENPQPVAFFSNTFEAYEDFSYIKFGVLEASEKARLAEAALAAEVWQHELPVQAVVDNRDVVVSRGVDVVEETNRVELRESVPRLHIIKIASASEAQPGDEVEFTIRFDNTGNERIGNVTILDNLTPRLEYIEGSAECDLAFEFFTTENEGGSLLLRFEITDPLDVQQGGIIRFKCRVR